MRQASTTLGFNTRGRGLTDITAAVADWLRTTGVDQGLLTLLCRHTSASLLIQENAAREVRTDLMAWFEQVAPEGDHYAHDDEGPDDMPAHLRATLTGVTLQVPVLDGRMRLGTWQGIYLAEHRRRPHHREVAVHLMGE
ncbi:secondary thiamine-phosphate synthase enzyme [Novosphingobium chloroacetimidivorans]|uniref:Secondary thiamine-phosphate synthase enzyme n=1 Tax=Novosphingobium chloroacetimidivorans TaxID=1428314 RepID=A0A7W7KDF3_9SPHN|nr:secondary thiamine-phosphate synthase enzyme YjbQ [Novosphingobium chloroacetimidivorans]MBB4860787.1 secondary thiamine-phosphate synthase enzyme [Novosphingobium chloroacetimidivorans]